MKTYFILLCMVTLAACNSSHKTTNSELQQIIIEKYKMLKTTLKNGDPTFVLNMHTNDAVLFKADGKEVVGIKALSELYKQVAASHVTIFVLNEN